MPADPHQAYCDWILAKDSWGGAIELSILSGHFKCEIRCIDIQTCQVHRFGEVCSSYTCAVTITVRPRAHASRLTTSINCSASLIPRPATAQASAQPSPVRLQDVHCPLPTHPLALRTPAPPLPCIPPTAAAPLHRMQATHAACTASTTASTTMPPPFKSAMGRLKRWTSAFSAPTTTAYCTHAWSALPPVPPSPE